MYVSIFKLQGHDTFTINFFFNFKNRMIQCLFRDRMVLQMFVLKDNSQALYLHYITTENCRLGSI